MVTFSSNFWKLKRDKTWGCNFLIVQIKKPNGPVVPITALPASMVPMVAVFPGMLSPLMAVAMLVTMILLIHIFQRKIFSYIFKNMLTRIKSHFPNWQFTISQISHLSFVFVFSTLFCEIFEYKYYKPSIFLSADNNVLASIFH